MANFQNPLNTFKTKKKSNIYKIYKTLLTTLKHGNVIKSTDRQTD